ncbi:MAG: hypothetical protein Q9170_002896 [Blastenia crenularia]
MCTCLPLLVKTSSLLYNRQASPHPRYTYEDLSSARSIFGIESLKHLETALKPTSLSENSKQQLEVLFMVVLGAIIAVTYTSTANCEEARLELVRILTHYLILVGERVGLLQDNMKKLQLTQGCHNLWNKTGAFTWDYGTQPTRNSAAFSAPDGCPPALMEGPRNMGSPVGALKSLLPDRHWESEPFLDFSTKCHLLHLTGSCVGVTKAAPCELYPDYAWPSDFGADWSSSRLATEMMTCLSCNRYHATNDSCSSCFSQLPGVAAPAEVILQNSCNPAQEILQPELPCPDLMETECFATHDTGALSSDGLGSSDPLIANLGSLSSQALKYSLRARTSIASDDLSNIQGDLKSKTTVKGSKRNLTIKGGKVVKNIAKSTQRELDDYYGAENVAYSHVDPIEERRPSQGRSHPIAAAHRHLASRVHQDTYLTPDSSYRATPPKTIINEDYHSIRTISGEGKCRNPALTTRISNQARRPELELESGEPDYSGLDSDEDE